MGLALKLSTTLWAPSEIRLANPPNGLDLYPLVASGTRRVNEAGVDLITTFEGKRLKAYHDSVGFPTQGIGRLLSRVKWEDLSKYPEISEEACLVWLQEDLDRFANGVLRLLPIPLNDNEFAALVSFSFNLGLGNLQSSTLRRMLLRGEPRVEVAGQFARWNKADGKVSKGLTRRRAAERVLFLL